MAPFFFSGASYASPVMIEEAAYYREEGRRYQGAGQIDQAIHAYQRSAQIFPEDADVHNDLGVMYEAKGQLQNAESEYLRAIQIENHHSGAHSNLALLYEVQGKIALAAPHWQQRVSIGPASDPWVARARESLVKYKLEVPRTGEVVAARERGEAALRYEEGVFFVERKRWAEAEAAFLQALDIDPNHRGAREGLDLARKRLKPAAPAGIISHEDDAEVKRPTSNVAPRKSEKSEKSKGTVKAAAPATPKAAAPAAPKAAVKASFDEGKRRKQKGEQDRRRQERQQQEVQRLLKRSEAIEKSAQEQQIQAAQHIARSIAMQKEADALKRKASGAAPAAIPAPVVPIVRRPAAVPQQTVITPKPVSPPVSGALAPKAVTPPPAVPRPVVAPPVVPAAPVRPVAPAAAEGSRTRPSGAPPAPAPVPARVAPAPAVRVSSTPAPAARVVATPAPAPIVKPLVREIRTSPVAPIKNSKEAQALAEQLARERERTRDLMVRELNQRGLILYRQKQYPQAIEQFQRALGMDPGNRETEQYLRDAQSAQTRGES
ncbi:MAG: tetratricopeptide repeat protein [Candidatus Omnitrophica bacterium]|nr:tetratricopeptide repeat protein [Candidatus Omnitrophota bacterium]